VLPDHSLERWVLERVRYCRHDMEQRVSVSRGMGAAVLLVGCAAALAPSWSTRASTHTAIGSSARGRHTVHAASHRNRIRQPALTAAGSTLHFAAPPVQARAAYLVDMDSGRTLYARNADARLAMASTTKITTAILAIQHGHLHDLVRVSRRAATVGESTMVLRTGERLSVHDLLYGLMLNSANDASIALAEHVSGSVESFVVRMNGLARRLHMLNTHYVTPHGLDAPGHYSSARDLATIARYAMRNRLFRQIVSTGSYHIPATPHNREHWLANINYPLFWYPGVDGVKPGDTDNAGLCQVISATRDGHHLMAVLMNTPTLVRDVRTLLDYGSHDFRWVQAPAYWDTPSTALSGGTGASRWVYYLGAGHYIRGLFLQYFRAHGGLATLGYPRTEELQDGGHWVQFFQGGELVYDPAHGSVYPQPLGAHLSRTIAGNRATAAPATASRPFRDLYRRLGGKDVLGTPVTGVIGVGGTPVQIYRYGALADQSGTPTLMPIGDAALRLRGLLPAGGAGNVHPATMSPSTALWAHPGIPRPPAPPSTRKKKLRNRLPADAVY
jgi:D-alanyl-D-alanine carboxypeptidase